MALKNYKMLVRRRLSSVVERFPRLYLAVMHWRYRNARFRQRIVTPQHKIMIEGYPRSGNSFADRAFKMSNSGSGIPITATHVHSPAHVLMAARYGVPTMVLIREPSPAVVSSLAVAMQVGMLNLRDASDFIRTALMQEAIRRYIRFYSSIESVLPKVLLVSFEQVTTDFGAVIDNMNEKFGTSFTPFRHTPENVAHIFERTKIHLSPNHDREAIKKDLMGLYYSPVNSALRNRAESLYEILLPLTFQDKEGQVEPRPGTMRGWPT